MNRLAGSFQEQIKSLTFRPEPYFAAGVLVAVSLGVSIAGKNSPKLRVKPEQDVPEIGRVQEALLVWAADRLCEPDSKLFDLFESILNLA